MFRDICCHHYALTIPVVVAPEWIQIAPSIPYSALLDRRSASVDGDMQRGVSIHSNFVPLQLHLFGYAMA